MPRVLCVAEKPSIARAITEILSGGRFTTRNGPSQYNKNFDFTYPPTNSYFTVTSVSGHMLEHDFAESHRKWHSCDPFELFDAPIETRVKQDCKLLERNLRQEAVSANTLMIWTDCDREGENIGNEVRMTCRKANHTIRVRRARFSAIVPAQIHHAAQNPIELDMAQSDAVEARTLLDLRLGAAFTRMQSLSLQASIGELDGTLVSYGPCQFPTLGFVVSRYEQVKSFAPEQFWYIYLTLTTNAPSEGEIVTEFSWKRHRLFELESVFALYELVLENPLATVSKITKKNTKRWKPYPLTTVELQKAASRILKLTPKKILDIAEGLYQKGFLSYPRTETDQYDDAFDFNTLIAKQTTDANWGAFATSLQNGGFSGPRKGRKNDKAHPPIHPTAYANNLNGDDKRVYEYITRRFLACCSKDAEGFETTVEVVAGGENFSATGLVILERNYLDVYIYDKWTGKFLPNFEEGQHFMPTVCELRDGTTTAPSYLTEADLVTMMDNNGIGTDATIAQHIQTIIDREYVMERMDGRTKYLVPSTLGIGLVEGYNKIGFDKSLSKPQLRRETERMMVQVCERRRTKAQILENALEQYREVFVRARNNFARVIDAVGTYVRSARDAQPNAGAGGNNDGNNGGGGGGGPGRGGGPRSGGGRGQPRGRGGPPGSRGRGGGSARATFVPASDDGFSSGDDRPSAARGQGVRRPAAGLSGGRAWGNAPTRGASPPPARSRSMNNRDPTQAGSTPNCSCSIPAQELSVVKESTNKGRKFWTCGHHPEKKCQFFEWMTGTSASATQSSGDVDGFTRPVVPAKRPQAPGGGRASESPPPCQCNQPAESRTVQKEGPNKGRSFWSCRKPQGTGCNFFSWTDETSESGSLRGLNNASMSNSDECFKCGQQGHWSSSCPTLSNQNKRSKTYPTNAENGESSGRSCFKCGEEGHFSNECPGSKSSAPRANGASSARASCFRCGEDGHYSKDCANGQKAARAGRGSKRGGRGGGRRSSSSSRGGSRRGKKFNAVD